LFVLFLRCLFVLQRFVLLCEITSPTPVNKKHTSGILLTNLSDDNNKTYILCELQGNQSHKLSHLKIGHPVKIKGVFKGHLVDLILLNCIIK